MYIHQQTRHTLCEHNQTGWATSARLYKVTQQVGVCSYTPGRALASVENNRFFVNRLYGRLVKSMGFSVREIRGSHTHTHTHTHVRTHARIYMCLVEIVPFLNKVIGVCLVRFNVSTVSYEWTFIHFLAFYSIRSISRQRGSKGAVLKSPINITQGEAFKRGCYEHAAIKKYTMFKETSIQ